MTDALCSRCGSEPRLYERIIGQACRRADAHAKRRAVPCAEEGCPEPRQVEKTRVRSYCTKHMWSRRMAADEKARLAASLPVKLKKPRPKVAPPGQHWCSGHQEWHPVADFNRFAQGFQGLQLSCREYQRGLALAAHDKDPEAARAFYRVRNSTYKKAWLYGMDEESIEAMRQEQRGRCKVCDRESDKLTVDHDHNHAKPRSRAAVRGLLCGGCNRGDGQLGSDPQRMLRLAWYVAHGGDMAGVEDFLARTSLA